MIEAVKILDGNSYVVAPNDALNTNVLEFDKIYNQKCVENNLDELFEIASKRYDVDINLLKAVGFVESGFNTHAVSKSGAMGIMQLMPYTAANYGVTNPYDAEQNINAGARLLSFLMDKYNGNITLAVAAYNAGSGAVDEAGGVPDKEQVKNYVSKINTALKGALHKDSWTIEGSEPTIKSVEPEIGQSYSNIVLGSVYAGMIYPSTSVVSQTNSFVACDNKVPGMSVLSGNELGNISDGSAYGHYIVNNRASYVAQLTEES